MTKRLYPYQKEAALSHADIVVLRWGLRTGKDTLIEALRGPEDFVIMPKGMAAESSEKYEGRPTFQDILINDNVLKHIKKMQKKHQRTKRIFLNDCAFFGIELMPLIVKLQRHWPKAQIYCLSTPRGGWKLGEKGCAGLEFDMLCARLEMSKVHGWSYSQVRSEANPKFSLTDEEFEGADINDLQRRIRASWWDIE